MAAQVATRRRRTLGTILLLITVGALREYKTGAAERCSPDVNADLRSPREDRDLSPTAMKRDSEEGRAVGVGRAYARATSSVMAIRASEPALLGMSDGGVTVQYVFRNKKLSVKRIGEVEVPAYLSMISNLAKRQGKAAMVDLRPLGTAVGRANNSSVLHVYFVPLTAWSVLGFPEGEEVGGEWFEMADNERYLVTLVKMHALWVQSC
ncbi:hypothetical protein BKA93DRAFT_751238 [Sparassis latifolia]